MDCCSEFRDSRVVFSRFLPRQPKKLELVSSAGRSYRVTLPPPTSDMPSGYAFAYWKSGSTLLDHMLQAYCNLTGVAYFSLFGQAFAQGITTSHVTQDAQRCFLPNGYVYSGFRHYPVFELEIGPRQPVVLLVRDPRDMLVSLYFSTTKSHVIPEGEENLAAGRRLSLAQSIDEFALEKCPLYTNAQRRYATRLAGKAVRIFRYEDVIFRKEEWMAELVYFLGLPYRRRFVSRVAAQFDVIPQEEDATKHIRKVSPGDYREKLKLETIRGLNDRLAPFLSAYGYA